MKKGRSVAALLLSWPVLMVAGNPPLANTTSGYYKGVQMETDRRLVNAFLGMEYGKAPTGTERFRPPQMADYRRTTAWSDTPARPCYQYIDNTYPGFAGTEMWNPNGAMTEHCLTLNLWAPADANNTAVLVWIFGGGFFSGSPSLDLYNGSTIAATNGIVVVNINYRLGPFGFFYLNDNDSPPNLGLLDQRLALEWLKRNVDKFGGNAKRITIMGESAGGASVMAHLHAPSSWPLFNYAIVISGTMGSPWAKTSKSKLRQHSVKFANQLGCEGDDHQLLECMRRIPAKKMQIQAQQTWFGTFMNFHFVPVIEDQLFFGKEGADNFFNHVTKNTTILIGYNADEGSYWLPTCLPNYFKNTGDGHVDVTQMETLLQLAFPHFDQHQLTDVARYYEAKMPTLRDSLSAMVGDYYFTCNVLDVAQRLVNQNRTVFLYQFNHRSALNPWPKWMGAMHGYEMEFIFGLPLRYKDKPYSHRDEEITKDIMEYWNSFVRYGIPLIRSRTAARWTAYSVQNPDYIYFGKNTSLLTMNGPNEGCELFKIAHSENDDNSSSAQPNWTLRSTLAFVILSFVVSMWYTPYNR